MQFIQYPDWLKPEIITGLPFRWYGMMYLLAFVITYFLVMYIVKKRKLNVSSDVVLNLFFWLIIGLLIGARIFATTIYDTTHKYIREPWLIFWPFDENGSFTGLQGMSYHGAIVGLAIAMIIFCRVKKLSPLDWGDMIVTAAPLGYTFGRIGNFINGELYGKVSDGPWAVLFPNARPLPTDQGWVVETANKVGISIPDGASFINLPRHPSQLYEAALEGVVLWVILWFFVNPRKPFKGFTLGMYLILYGFFRFIIEYVREPDAGLDYVVMFGPRDNPPELFQSLLNFTTGQVLNFLMIVAGILCIVAFKLISDRRPKAETFDTGPTGKPEKDWGAPKVLTAEEIEKKKERRRVNKKLKK